jgi:peptidoglycan/LPS O-acetylase OafA/YrhL
MLRIFPGLVGCILFSALVLGPALTSESWRDYFTDGAVFRFVLRNSFLDVYSVPFLPGFAYHPLDGGAIVNGSLWSLPFEFAFYSIVLVCGICRRLSAATAGVLLGLTLLSLTFGVLDGYGWFLSYFAAGMCLYFLRRAGSLSGRLAACAGVAVLAGFYGGLPWPFFPILGAYLVIYLAADAPFEIRGATRFGDLSYGIYLYGWPCEEIAARWLGGEPAWWQIFLVALPMAATLAWLSWHAVERPALRWKDVPIEGVRRRSGAAASLAYGAIALVFGIGKIFGLGAILPAALAMAGGAAVTALAARRPVAWPLTAILARAAAPQREG